MFSFAGIGSRSTPTDMLRVMSHWAQMLALSGWCLRSGGAAGADSAFESGCDRVSGAKQIFLPWRGFNENRSRLYTQHPDAFRIAAEFHPAWDRLSGPVRKLMARNVHQILGPNLDDPVRLVVCWTPNGSGSGGTGQALRIATARGIPIVDFGS